MYCQEKKIFFFFFLFRFLFDQNKIVSLYIYTYINEFICILNLCFFISSFNVMVTIPFNHVNLFITNLLSWLTMWSNSFKLKYWRMKLKKFVFKGGNWESQYLSRIKALNYFIHFLFLNKFFCLKYIKNVWYSIER